MTEYVPIGGQVGKTVASVEVKNMAARDTFKDIITWEQTIVTFTDGTACTFADESTETYDQFEYSDWDEENNEPIPINNQPFPWEQ